MTIKDVWHLFRKPKQKDFVDVTPKKKKIKIKKEPYSEQKVVLHCITRHAVSARAIEYADTIKTNVPTDELPANAHYIIGSKNEYAVVMFDPVQIPEPGSFDAVGYYLYYCDRRMDDAFANVAISESNNKNWLKYAVIAGGAVIFVFVLLRFL